MQRAHALSDKAKRQAPGPLTCKRQSPYNGGPGLGDGRHDEFESPQGTALGPGFNSRHLHGFALVAQWQRHSPEEAASGSSNLPEGTSSRSSYGLNPNETVLGAHTSEVQQVERLSRKEEGA